MRTFAIVSALAVALAVHPAAQVQAQEQTPTEQEQLQRKCTLCHSSHRVLTADPSSLSGIVSRMEAKNPDWFKDTSAEHLVAALAKILDDPEIAARRKSWDETVARGRELFADASLGTAGKSCASCHDPAKMQNIADAFPIYDQKLGRYVSLQERINQMVSGQMGGKDLPLGDERSVAIEAYLSTLR